MRGSGLQVRGGRGPASGSGVRQRAGRLWRHLRGGTRLRLPQIKAVMRSYLRGGTAVPVRRRMIDRSAMVSMCPVPLVSKSCRRVAAWTCVTSALMQLFSRLSHSRASSSHVCASMHARHPSRHPKQTTTGQNMAENSQCLVLSFLCMRARRPSCGKQRCSSQEGGWDP